MSILLAASGMAVALGALAVSVAAAFRILKGATQVHDAPRRDVFIAYADREWHELKGRVEALALQVEELPSLWEREAERAEHAAELAKGRSASARAALSAARKLKEGDEDPDLDDSHLLAGDGEAGHGSQLQLLSEDVEPDPEEDLTRRALAVGWSPFI